MRRRDRRTAVLAFLAATAIAAAGCDASRETTDGRSARVVAVGDIACGTPPAPTGSVCRYDIVADATNDEQPDLFLALGDTQYETPSGSVDYAFYDRAFGSLRPITLPTPGDEDWIADREAYLDYFGDRTTETGYDSHVIAGWHIVVLNSQDCFDADGCPAGSAQLGWLRDVLADPPGGASGCTLAIWHDPRFLWADWWSEGGMPRGPQNHVAPLWKLLAEAGAEVVLNGNAHHYERWAPMDADGAADPLGMTEFVVGTGGRSLNPLGPQPRPELLEAAQDDGFGVLVLDLRPGGLDYRWRGAEEADGFDDRGSIDCH
jgi:hypothetical protein